MLPLHRQTDKGMTKFFESMKYNELERKLKKAGCFRLRQGGRHEIWYSPATGKTHIFSRHGNEEVPVGILRDIMKTLLGG